MRDDTRLTRSGLSNWVIIIRVVQGMKQMLRMDFYDGYCRLLIKMEDQDKGEGVIVWTWIIRS